MLYFQHPFLHGDLTRRLATELLDKYWNSNSQYMDPSELDDPDDQVCRKETLNNLK